MIDLYEDTGFRKMVFLRFNPDSYQAEDTRHPSPFSFTEAGTISVDQKEFDHRMRLLNERIQVWKEREPIEQWTVEYLFYNVGTLRVPTPLSIGDEQLTPLSLEDI